MPHFKKRFMLVYLLMLGVTLIAFTFIYSRSVEIIEQSLVSNRLANLQQLRTNVDNNLGGIVDSVTHVSINSQIRNFANISDPYVGTNIIRIMETIRTFQDNNVVNPMLRNIFIVYDSNEVVITPTAAWQLYRFSSQHMIVENLNPIEWRELVFYNNYYPRFIPATTIDIGDDTFEAIHLITPIRTLLGNSGAVIALLDNRILQDMFSILSTDLSETALIVNSSGEIITSLFGTQHIPDLPSPAESGEGVVHLERNGINYLMIYTDSNILDWTYVSIIRSDYALTELNMFRNLVFFALLVMTILTFAISIIYSVLQSRPIIKLQDTISAQMPLLQQAHLRDLLGGKLLSVEDAPADTLGLDLKSSRYIVTLIAIKEDTMDLEYLAKVRMFVDGQAAVNYEPNVKFHSVNMSGNEFAVLFTGEDIALDEHVHKFVNLLAQEMFDTPKITVGIGNAYDSLEGIKKSYSEAMDAVQYYLMTDARRTICYFSEVPNSIEMYYYPDEEEKRLLNMVRSGDDNGVHETLSAILNENLVSRELSSNMMVAFIDHLCLGLFKIGKINIANKELLERVREFHSYHNQLDDLEKMTRCTQLYTDISKAICGEKQNKMQIIVSELKAMCENDFQNPDLSLTDISSRHNLSEAYLSQQFKELTGENFHSYLQDIRINYAIKKLTSTNKPIREISEASGYTSYNTFSKAFKRKTGVNAGDYRRHKDSIL